jgi:hypothetical protein
MLSGDDLAAQTIEMGNLRTLSDFRAHFNNAGMDPLVIHQISG